MNREFLKELGIEADAIDKIMKQNGEDIEQAKGGSEKNAKRVEELEAEVKSLKSDIGNRDKQLEELKKASGDNEDLKKQIDDLTAANKKAADDHAREMESLRKSHAIESALVEAKAKGVKAALAYIDADKVSIDANGNVTGLEDQIKALKGADDTKFLFDSGNPTVKGVKPGQASDPDKPGTYTRKEILAMPYSKQQEIFNRDPEGYRAIMGE